MSEISYLAAFLGGALSLLTPCSALLLPAFFAYAFSGSGELVRKTTVFYAGLCATLVPLGMGISAVSSIFYGERQTLILVAGVVLILLGVVILFGGGFSLGFADRLRSRIRGDSAGAVFALGAVYGFAGFCSGPILGAVLTVAAASGGVGGTFRGATLLAVYALGMAAPLFVLALLWDRFDLGRLGWLRGREVSLGPLRVHTTNLVSGLLFIALGVVFIVYEGTSALAGVYDSNGASGVAFSVEGWIGAASDAVPDWAVIVSLALIASAALVWWYFRDEADGEHRDEHRKETP